MKRKLLTLGLLALISFAFMSCDEIMSQINKVQTALGFYDEYQTYGTIYEEATQMTVLAETTLSISDSTVNTEAGDLTEIDTSLYLMIDKNSTFIYVEEELLDVSQNCLYETDGELYVQYLIGEDDVVTPSLPEAEDRFDSSYDVNILNENFSYESISGEETIEDHKYAFDVNLTQAINLDALGDFVDQLAIFGGDQSSFDDAVAHVVISFTETDNVIDVTATLTDYTITFDDETYVTLTLVNHTVLSVPDTFEMPDIFSAQYQYVAQDNVLLARRAYAFGETIAYPVTSGQNGYNLLTLDAGSYSVSSDANSANFTYQIFDADMNEISLTGGEFTVTETSDFFLYVIPTADFVSDIVITGTVVQATETLTSETDTVA